MNSLSMLQKQAIDPIQQVSQQGGSLFFLPRIVLFFFLSGLFLFSICRADELLLNDRKIKDFADFLYLNGEYYRAISEYKRLIYYFPESGYLSEANIHIGKAFLAGGEIGKSIEYLENRITNFSLTDNESLQIFALLGIAWFDLEAGKSFTLRKSNVEKGVTYLNKIALRTPQGNDLKDFVHSWREGPEEKPKTPWIAGAMSALIPGSGSFYSGRYKEGVYTFLITSLFFWATMDAIHHKKDHLAYVFGFFTLSFYGGNIYTAVNGVHRYNDDLYSEHLFNLRSKYGLWFVPEREGFQGRY